MLLPFGNMQTEPTARAIEAEDWAALASVSRPGEREVEVGELAIVTGPSSARTRVHPVGPPRVPDGTSQSLAVQAPCA